jgi:short-subunit dehydrogenase
VAGAIAVPQSGPYTAAKHAQLAFSRAATAELRPRGIRVHTVNPGFAATEGFPQDWLLRTRLRRFVLSADDVADGILRALDEGETEVYVPGWYRAAAIAQALAPGLTARVLSGRRSPAPS